MTNNLGISAVNWNWQKTNTNVMLLRNNNLKKITLNHNHIIIQTTYKPIDWLSFKKLQKQTNILMLMRQNLLKYIQNNIKLLTTVEDLHVLSGGTSKLRMYYYCGVWEKHTAVLTESKTKTCKQPPCLNALEIIAVYTMLEYYYNIRLCLCIPYQI